jgi:hypothetical protein
MRWLKELHHKIRKNGKNTKTCQKLKESIPKKHPEGVK